MGLIKNELELVSIHIPKTGGTSFQKSLKKLYGRGAFLRLDFSIRQEAGEEKVVATKSTSPEPLEEIIHKGVLDPSIKAIHGHFHYSHFAQVFEVQPTTKVVTWVREPLERIISNYNFLNAILERELKHTEKSRNVLRRLVKSPIEFARTPRDINLYPDYLKGRSLSEYDFIGIIEHYEDELRRLETILGAEKIARFHKNKTADKPKPKSLSAGLSAIEEEELKKLYAKNIDIYESAIQLRNHTQ